MVTLHVQGALVRVQRVHVGRASVYKVRVYDSHGWCEGTGYVPTAKRGAWLDKARMILADRDAETGTEPVLPVMADRAMRAKFPAARRWAEAVEANPTIRPRKGRK